MRNRSLRRVLGVALALGAVNAAVALAQGAASSEMDPLTAAPTPLVASLFEPDQTDMTLAYAFGRTGNPVRPQPGMTSIEQAGPGKVRILRGLVIGRNGIAYPPITLTLTVGEKGPANIILKANDFILTEYNGAADRAEDFRRDASRRMDELTQLLSADGCWVEEGGLERAIVGPGANRLIRLMAMVRESPHTELERACALYRMGYHSFGHEEDRAAAFAARGALGPGAKPEAVQALAAQVLTDAPYFDLVTSPRGGYTMAAKGVSVEYCVGRLAQHLNVKIVADPGLRDTVAMPRNPVGRGVPLDALIESFASQAGAKVAKEGAVYKLSPIAAKPATVAKPWVQAWQVKTQWSWLRPHATPNGLILAMAKFGSLCAFNAKDGSVAWETELKGEKHEASITDLFITDGVAYFGGGDNDMYAVRVSDGKKLWSFQAPIPMEGSIRRNHTVWPVGAVGGVFLFSSTDDTVYAVDRQTGKEAWHRAVALGSGAALDNDTLYLLAKGPVLALNAKTRETLWEYRGESLPGSRLFKSADALYAMAKGKAAAISAKDGKLLWRAAVDCKGRMDGEPIFLEEKLIFPGRWEDNHVYALDTATGKPVWTANVPGFANTLAILDKDRILVGTNTGHVCVIDAASGQVLSEMMLGISYTAVPLVIGRRIIVGGREPSGGEHATGLLTAYDVPE
jgi:outer membrane protein assembly factor BamB